MKKVLKTVLILLVVLIIVLGVTAYLNRGNIKAFLLAYTTSQEELKDKINSGVVDNEVLSNYTDITLRDLTEEEKSKLANNEISEEDAVAIIMGMLDSPSEQPENEAVETPENPNTDSVDTPVTQAPEEAKPSTEAPEAENPPENIETDTVPVVKEEPVPSIEPEKPVENAETPGAVETPEVGTEVSEETEQVNKKVAELVAKLYVVRAKVISKFDAYIEQLKTEYDADRTLTKEERKATKPQFAARAVKVVAKWEKECDTEMNAILSEIETLLKESGQSLELVDTIRKAYEDEKAAKKAYCINQYLD